MDEAEWEKESFLVVEEWAIEGVVSSEIQKS